MIKIQIPDNRHSDVSDMRAKGWHAMIFRGTETDDDFITVEKRDVRFVVRIVPANGEKCIEIAKYINGAIVDTKRFYENGCGITGTLNISEGKDNSMTYAFFRNEKLQNIIDDFGLRKVIFPKEADEKFEKDVQISIDRYRQYSGNHPIAPPFHTDGTYEEIKSDDSRLKKWHISNATYIYEYTTAVLTIQQKYDTDKIRATMNELMS